MSSTPRLPQAYLSLHGSSFLDFLEQQAPTLLTQRVQTAIGSGTGQEHMHATTIVAVTYAHGVVMAGDRRATLGSPIAHREIEQVFAADDDSAVGIAGVAGVGIELVRLFQLELEHYEKIEGTLLSLDGKANRLASLLRGNLSLALQGLSALPMLAGYDVDRGVGRLFSYDVTGGRYEERETHSLGSGSPWARGTLKSGWRPDLSSDQAVALAVSALQSAADEDSATGGIDVVRGIYPVVAVVDSAGYRRISDGEIANLALARGTAAGEAHT